MKLYPSIFAFKDLNIGNEISRFDGISSGLHVDIIDGKYINNFGFPIYMTKMLKQYTNKSIHIHVMGFIDDLIGEIISCNPDVVFFHADSTSSPQNIINILQSNNIQIGLAVSDFKKEISLHDEIDLCKNSYKNKIVDLYKVNNLNYLLFMTVNPGKCGQKFIESKKLELQQLNEIFPNVKIIIDGGVNPDILKQECIKNNVYGAVIGSALYKYNVSHFKQ
ncbi:hypothetical protein FZC35_00985 [Candidatus Cytomitobacter indipagum]|uniref:Ribulose-phosphate 3-epimerase n=1 Tax=Candidatus Cytomitobacter indipagum TaxID=2601575 RepID=A0A5C0UD46_9PROT|nr:hypothetical protein [Candidatus Cytomitobacter indipagum]QEK37956.1 hypothetical protein FZC35_00985 [Candidatus Cytomitobacter indipagum]